MSINRMNGKIQVLIGDTYTQNGENSFPLKMSLSLPGLFIYYFFYLINMP